MGDTNLANKSIDNFKVGAKNRYSASQLASLRAIISHLDLFLQSQGCVPQQVDLIVIVPNGLPRGIESDSLLPRQREEGCRPIVPVEELLPKPFPTEVGPLLAHSRQLSEGAQGQVEKDGFLRVECAVSNNL